MKEPQHVPTAMIPIRDLGLHARMQSLQQIFTTLALSLNPIITNGPDGMELYESGIGSGVRTSIETALIQTCNRICALMEDSKNWEEDDQAKNILSSLMHQAIQDMEKKPVTKRKKGTTDEQK